MIQAQNIDLKPNEDGIILTWDIVEDTDSGTVLMSFTRLISEVVSKDQVQGYLEKGIKSFEAIRSIKTFYSGKVVKSDGLTAAAAGPIIP